MLWYPVAVELVGALVPVGALAPFSELVPICAFAPVGALLLVDVLVHVGAVVPSILTAVCSLVSVVALVLSGFQNQVLSYPLIFWYLAFVVRIAALVQVVVEPIEVWHTGLRYPF